MQNEVKNEVILFSTRIMCDANSDITDTVLRHLDTWKYSRLRFFLKTTLV